MNWGRVSVVKSLKQYNLKLEISENFKFYYSNINQTTKIDSCYPNQQT